MRALAQSGPEPANCRLLDPDRQRPRLFAEALRAAKRAVDRQALLNPGVLIDPERGAR